MEREGVKIWHPETCNISEQASIGVGTTIHSHVSIHDWVSIGKNCQLEAYCVLFNGVTLEDEVFIGPHVCFTNDPTLDVTRELWTPTPTTVKRGAKIGANSTIRAGCTIGEYSIVGMGSVVLHDIPPHEVWVGNPCRFLKSLKPKQTEEVED